MHTIPGVPVLIGPYGISTDTYGIPYGENADDYSSL
jgi:hypothetical protein